MGRLSNYRTSGSTCAQSHCSLGDKCSKRSNNIEMCGGGFASALKGVWDAREDIFGVTSDTLKAASNISFIGEKAVKDILRQEINSVFSMDYSSNYIDYDFYSTILEMLEEQKQVAREENLPSIMRGNYAIQFVSKSID